jgi:hypothetical protein
LTQYRLGGTSSSEPNEAEDSAGDHVLEGLSIPMLDSSSADADAWGVTGFQLSAAPGESI